MTQREECRSDLLTWTVVLTPENTFIVTSAPGFPRGARSKEPTCQWRDAGLIPGSGRSPRVGNGNPFQYSSLENPMDRGAGWAVVVHRVTNSRTWLTQPLHHWIKLSPKQIHKDYLPTPYQKVPHFAFCLLLLEQGQPAIVSQSRVPEKICQ